MTAFDPHRHTRWLKSVMDTIADFIGEALLNLQSPRKHIDHACDFAEPYDVTVRDISDMCFTKEGQHVMLAHRIDFDVLDYYHLAVLFFKHSAAQYMSSIKIIAMCQELQSFGYALGSFNQSFAVWVFAQRF